MSDQADFTLGVEEEYQIVERTSRELRQRADPVLHAVTADIGDAAQPEMYRSMVEVGTQVCKTLADVREGLVGLRATVRAAAQAADGELAVSGTHPFSDWRRQQVSEKERYQDLLADYRLLMRELVVFGCHVHVGIPDREAAIQTMNRALPWLSVLTALAGNSPFWLGEDSGYSSYRFALWQRWPLAGIPGRFESRAEFDALVDDLVTVGTIEDGTKLYWDIRPSARFDTIEFRAADACLAMDDAVMIAGLARGIARTCHDAAMAGEPMPRIRPELLRTASWHAARFGLDADLIDVTVREAVPARTLVERVLEAIGPALEAAGDLEEVTVLVRRTLERGNGAARQRAAFARRGELTDVVDAIVAEGLTG